MIRMKDFFKGDTGYMCQIVLRQFYLLGGSGGLDGGLSSQKVLFQLELYLCACLCVYVVCACLCVWSVHACVCACLCVVCAQEKRTDIAREFINWLKDCHEQFDKQIKFCSFIGTITRPDLPKKYQAPWSVFEEVEWDNKTYKKGSLVRVLSLVSLSCVYCYFRCLVFASLAKLGLFGHFICWTWLITGLTLFQITWNCHGI